MFEIESAAFNRRTNSATLTGSQRWPTDWRLQIEALNLMNYRL